MRTWPLKPSLQDKYGKPLSEGDRVKAWCFPSKKFVEGTLHYGIVFCGEDDWWVAYDDGEECIVMNSMELIKL